MASLGGSVDFARMKQQLRQLFRPPNSVTKEDIVRRWRRSLCHEGRTYRTKPGRPFVINKDSRREQRLPPALPPKVALGRSPNHRRGRRKKMALTDVLGNATVVMAVEVNTIFRPNVQPSRNGRLRFRRLLHLRTLGRLFPPSPWGIPRRMSTRRNTHLPPP